MLVLVMETIHAVGAGTMRSEEERRWTRTGIPLPSPFLVPFLVPYPFPVLDPFPYQPCLVPFPVAVEAFPFPFRSGTSGAGTSAVSWEGASSEVGTSSGEDTGLLLLLQQDQHHLQDLLQFHQGEEDTGGTAASCSIHTLAACWTHILQIHTPEQVPFLVRSGTSGAETSSEVGTSAGPWEGASSGEDTGDLRLGREAEQGTAGRAVGPEGCSEGCSGRCSSGEWPWRVCCLVLVRCWSHFHCCSCFVVDRMALLGLAVASSSCPRALWPLGHLLVGFGV